MFNKEKIIEILNSEDLFIDNFILEAFIKNWKIEPIYEDADGIEFFDEMAVEKIRSGIKNKQPKCEINIMDKDEIKPVDMAVEMSEPHLEEVEPPVEAVEQKIEEIEQPIEDTEQPEPPAQEIVQEIYTEPQELPVSIINEVNKEVENELKNVTLDISNQTLAVLAESIARKITYDVADFIKKTARGNPVLDTIKDSLKDIGNNWQGTVYGVMNPDKDCKVWLEDLDWKNNKFIR